MDALTSLNEGKAAMNDDSGSSAGAESTSPSCVGLGKRDLWVA